MFRKTIFWMHLVSGVVVGLVVAMMSITGVALAFQPQILAWARSDLGQLLAPPGDERLPLEALVERAQKEMVGKEATGLTLSAEPRAAVMVRFGRSDLVYVNPWSGEILEDPAAGWARSFALLTSWHRWLAMEGESRTIGRAITGASNTAFGFLAISGLYLWFPRRWRWPAFRQTLWFRRGLRSKARDWNWHHVIGFWSLPVLLVLIVSGMVISYTWASRLIYTMTGSEPPATQGRPGPPKVAVPVPPEGAGLLSLDELVSGAKRTIPAAEELTLALPAPSAGGAPSQAVHLTIRERDASPPFARTRIALDPYTGDVLHLSGHADQVVAGRIRGWLRFLHTGEALGWQGQLVAGLASFGAVVLVWTGFALSYRRFVRARRGKAGPP